MNLDWMLLAYAAVPAGCVFVLYFALRSALGTARQIALLLPKPDAQVAERVAYQTVAAYERGLEMGKTMGEAQPLTEGMKLPELRVRPPQRAESGPFADEAEEVGVN